MDQILRRPCTLEPSVLDARVLSNNIANSAEDSEASLVQSVMTALFPSQYASHSKIVKRAPFSRQSLPTGRPEWRSTIQYSISRTRPYFAFGYTTESDLSLNRVQHLPVFNLEKVCDTSVGLYRPYFIAEFKALPNQRAATNQVAGAGAACVNVAKSLYACAPATFEGNTSSTFSMAFSATINGLDARLWVHWSQPDSWEIRMACIKGYHLLEADQLILLRRHIHQIIDWGLTDRYELQKRCLRVLADEAERQEAARMTGLMTSRG